MTAIPKQRITETEYLAFERASETKHEYYRGEVFAMAGASKNHNRIAARTISLLDTQLRKRPCEVFPSDMRLKISATGLYTYPHISIVCGEAKFTEDKPDTLLNPILIVELLSPSPEKDDRLDKFRHYRTLLSLREYVLIAQDSYHIEHYVRQPDSSWVLREADDLTTTLELPSIQCRLALADVYERVTFDDENLP